MTLPGSLPTSQELADRAGRLALIGYGGLAVAAAYLWYQSVWENQLVNLLGIAILVLGVVPMLRWLQRNDEAYPLPELMQFTLVPFYAIPLMTAHEEVVRYPESTLLAAAGVVILFQVCCLAGAILVDRSPAPRPRRGWWVNDLVDDNNLQLTGYAYMLTTVWLLVSNFTSFVSPELAGTLRAIFFGIGTICAFIQARLWGSGHLSRGLRILFAVNVVAQFTLMNLSLVLVTSMIMFLLILVGYFSSARRIPLLVCALALPAFAILHSGKHKMRDKYWGEYGRAASFAEVPSYYQEWFGYGLRSVIKFSDQEPEQKRSTIFERASLFQLVCYAVDTVPDHTPYLGGSTYNYIWPQVIPRVLWPEKPSPNKSVTDLSVRLGVLTEDQAETTSIGYGLITESYANFGLFGPALIGGVIGWGLRRIARSTAFCGTLSGGGIFRILCLAWCLNTETTMAVWLSSFYQACVAIYAPLLFYNSFLR